jgi:oligopeptide/dipeptide ABC transporter ATP-binding protein
LLESGLMSTSAPLLEVRDLRKHFEARSSLFRRKGIRAVDGVSFRIARGETLGLVGESGCGKSTTARAILHLVKPSSGQVLLEGRDVSTMRQAELRYMRRELQVVFQDPFASLNPRMSAEQILLEPLINFGLGDRQERVRRVREVFDQVGLPAEKLKSYPHEFSGGQRQRLGIGRALVLGPKLIVCDEPVSALDVSVQAQIINLLVDLQRRLGLAYLFVAHDLAVVEHISHYVAVMYLGQIVEFAPTEDLFSAPLHPYTQALLAAVPVPDPRRRKDRQLLKGDAPSVAAPPIGCRFYGRCPLAEPACSAEPQQLVEIRPGHKVACRVRLRSEASHARH